MTRRRCNSYVSAVRALFLLIPAILPCAWAPGAAQAAVADFDGDNTTDLVIYRTSTGEWFIRKSADGATESFFFGRFSTDVPAIWRDSNLGTALPAILSKSAPGGSASAVWIRPNDVRAQRIDAWWMALPGYSGPEVVLGEFTQDGFMEISGWARSVGVWHIQPVSMYGNFPTISIPWAYGGSTYADRLNERIAVADYDGDGLTDLATWNQLSGLWTIRRSGDNTILQTTWGMGGDLPVPADYDGDGNADVAVFRPSNGTWYIVKSSGGFIETSWGTDGDVPVPGDYDGDGTSDIAVWRRATGRWYIVRSTGGVQDFAWGTAEDPASATVLDIPVNAVW